MRRVTAEIPHGVFQQLHEMAQREGRSLDELVREAIEVYVRAAAEPIQDPLLDFVGRGELAEGEWSRRDDWRTSQGGS